MDTREIEQEVYDELKEEIQFLRTDGHSQDSALDSLRYIYERILIIKLGKDPCDGDINYDDLLNSDDAYIKRCAEKFAILSEYIARQIENKQLFQHAAWLVAGVMAGVE